MGMEWADDLGQRQDEEFGFRYVEQQASMDHAYGVLGGHLEPESWQGKGTHPEWRWMGTEAGT